jgi:hypothetical protein
MKSECVHADCLYHILDAMLDVSLFTEAANGKESARKKD